MKLLKGEPVAEKIYTDISRTLKSLGSRGIRPRLAVVLVGNDPASLAYIAVKKKKAAQLGIIFDFFHFPSSIEQTKLGRKIAQLNRRPGLAGIIVQLPLPPSLDRRAVLDCVRPEFDIDGLTSVNQARLAAASPAAFTPPTPAGILALLAHYKINLTGKRVVIVGAGELVGKPLSRLLRQQGIKASLATARTKNLAALTKTADIIITGVGKPGVLRDSMVKKGVVVVDAGTFLARSLRAARKAGSPSLPSKAGEAGKTTILGDVDFVSVGKKASAITPVPGGVGPLTVAMLYKNFVISCRRLFDLRNSLRRTPKKKITLREEGDPWM